MTLKDIVNFVNGDYINDNKSGYIFCTKRDIPLDTQLVYHATISEGPNGFSASVKLKPCQDMVDVCSATPR